MKYCPLCKESKLLSEFWKNKSRKDGVHSRCKKCSIAYNKTKKGLITTMYKSQKKHSLHRKHPLPNYTKTELESFLLNNKDFNKIYLEWEKSNYYRWLVPSCDRIDDYLPYTLDNIKVTTWWDNMKKGHQNIKDGINNKRSKKIAKYKDGVLIKVYYSISSAGRDNNLSVGNIVNCAKGKFNHIGGFQWKYM